MKNYKKSLIWLFIILTQIAFAIYLIFSFGHLNVISRYEVNMVVKKYASEDEFGLMLWNDTKEFKNANDVCIKWWHNDNNDRYYIFIPKGILKNGLYWIFPNADSVCIDDEKIYNGSLYSLAEGVHIVKAEINEIVKDYEIEIRYFSDIGSLFLTTQSGNTDMIDADKKNYESGSYTLFDNSGQFLHAGFIDKMHGRGNVTWEDPKKSYSINLQKSADILEMGKASGWNLISNCYDSTLVRNVIAFDMASSIGLQYTPEARFINVYINGEFYGNYILTEKIEVSENRVNINDLGQQTEQINIRMFGNYENFYGEEGRLRNIKGFIVKNEPKDISGGYLLELDLAERYSEEVSGFETSRSQLVVIKSPSEASYSQTVYIANRYQDFEDAIFDDNGISPYTGISYLDYIDINSFARKYLIEELTKNFDAAKTSQYIYKPADDVSEKFFAGPVWDYDLSMARGGGGELEDPNGLYAAKQDTQSDIWYALYNHSEFKDLVVEIFFNELKPKAIDIVEDEIDCYVNNMTESIINNSIRWKNFTDDKEIMSQYNTEIDKLKNFLADRTEFLTDEWSK